jgi:hypothetical protein
MSPARLQILAAAVAALAGPASPRAFQNVAVGEPVEDAEMPTLGGGREHVLGKARANVFVFFRPGQEHSLDTLRRLARLETELAGKPVRWVAIVSDDSPADEVRRVVRETGIRMPVLVDGGNAFYGKLGVRLHPVVGVAGADHRLAAYEHFMEVNMEERVRARIRRVLGEIGDAEVDRVLEPPKAAVESGQPVVAKRYVNLARTLLERKNTEKAKEMARKALEADAGNAAAHAVLGQALAAEGKCGEASKAFAEALRLDPREPAALAGRAACAGK